MGEWRIIARHVPSREELARLDQAEDRWFREETRPSTLQISTDGGSFATAWLNEDGETIHDWLDDALETALRQQFELLGIQPWDWNWTEEPEWNELFESGF